MGCWWRCLLLLCLGIGIDIAVRWLLIFGSVWLGRKWSNWWSWLCRSIWKILVVLVLLVCVVWWLLVVFVLYVVWFCFCWWWDGCDIRLIFVIVLWWLVLIVVWIRLCCFGYMVLWWLLLVVGWRLNWYCCWFGRLIGLGWSGYWRLCVWCVRFLGGRLRSWCWLGWWLVGR